MIAELQTKTIIRLFDQMVVERICAVVGGELVHIVCVGPDVTYDSSYDEALNLLKDRKYYGVIKRLNSFSFHGDYKSDEKFAPVQYELVRFSSCFDVIKQHE